MGNNIFSNSDENKNKIEFRKKVDTHSKAILNVVQRQKDIESTLDLVKDKLELIDHNSVKNNKDNFKEIKTIKSDLRDLRLEIKKLKELNSKIVKQLKLMSPKDEVKKLEKYIDLWNPMGFVTREELEEKRNKNEKTSNNEIINTDKFLTKKEFETQNNKFKEEIKEIIKNFLTQ